MGSDADGVDDDPLWPDLAGLGLVLLSILGIVIVLIRIVLGLFELA